MRKPEPWEHAAAQAFWWLEEEKESNRQQRTGFHRNQIPKALTYAHGTFISPKTFSFLHQAEKSHCAICFYCSSSSPKSSPSPKAAFPPPIAPLSHFKDNGYTGPIVPIQDKAESSPSPSNTVFDPLPYEAAWQHNAEARKSKWLKLEVEDKSIGRALLSKRAAKGLSYWSEHDPDHGLLEYLDWHVKEASPAVFIERVTEKQFSYHHDLTRPQLTHSRLRADMVFEGLNLFLDSLPFEWFTFESTEPQLDLLVSSKGSGQRKKSSRTRHLLRLPFPLQLRPSAITLVESVALPGCRNSDGSDVLIPSSCTECPRGGPHRKYCEISFRKQVCEAMAGRIMGKVVIERALIRTATPPRKRRPNDHPGFVDNWETESIPAVPVKAHSQRDRDFKSFQTAQTEKRVSLSQTDGSLEGQKTLEELIRKANLSSIVQTPVEEEKWPDHEWGDGDNAEEKAESEETEKKPLSGASQEGWGDWKPGYGGEKQAEGEDEEESSSCKVIYKEQLEPGTIIGPPIAGEFKVHPAFNFGKEVKVEGSNFDANFKINTPVGFLFFGPSSGCITNEMSMVKPSLLEGNCAAISVLIFGIPYVFLVAGEGANAGERCRLDPHSLNRAPAPTPDLAGFQRASIFSVPVSLCLERPPFKAEQGREFRGSEKEKAMVDLLGSGLLLELERSQVIHSTIMLSAKILLWMECVRLAESDGTSALQASVRAKKRFTSSSPVGKWRSLASLVKSFNSLDFFETQQLSPVAAVATRALCQTLNILSYCYDLFDGHTEESLIDHLPIFTCLQHLKLSLIHLSTVLPPRAAALRQVFAADAPNLGHYPFAKSGTRPGRMREAPSTSSDRSSTSSSLAGRKKRSGGGRKTDNAMQARLWHFLFPVERFQENDLLSDLGQSAILRATMEWEVGRAWRRENENFAFQAGRNSRLAFPALPPCSCLYPQRLSSPRLPRESIRTRLFLRNTPANNSLLEHVLSPPDPSQGIPFEVALGNSLGLPPLQSLVHRYDGLSLDIEPLLSDCSNPDEPSEAAAPAPAPAPAQRRQADREPRRPSPLSSVLPSPPQQEYVRRGRPYHAPMQSASQRSASNSPPSPRRAQLKIIKAPVSSSSSKSSSEPQKSKKQRGRKKHKRSPSSSTEESRHEKLSKRKKALTKKHHKHKRLSSSSSSSSSVPRKRRSKKDRKHAKSSSSSSSSVPKRKTKKNSKKKRSSSSSSNASSEFEKKAYKIHQKKKRNSRLFQTLVSAADFSQREMPASRQRGQALQTEPRPPPSGNDRRCIDPRDIRPVQRPMKTLQCSSGSPSDEQLSSHPPVASRQQKGWYRKLRDRSAQQTQTQQRTHQWPGFIKSDASVSPSTESESSYQRVRRIPRNSEKRISEASRGRQLQRKCTLELNVTLVETWVSWQRKLPRVEVTSSLREETVKSLANSRNIIPGPQRVHYLYLKSRNSNGEFIDEAENLYNILVHGKPVVMRGPGQHALRGALHPYDEALEDSNKNEVAFPEARQEYGSKKKKSAQRDAILFGYRNMDRMDDAFDYDGYRNLRDLYKGNLKGAVSGKEDCIELQPSLILGDEFSIDMWFKLPLANPGPIRTAISTGTHGIVAVEKDEHFVFRGLKESIPYITIGDKKFYAKFKKGHRGWHRLILTCNSQGLLQYYLDGMDIGTVQVTQQKGFCHVKFIGCGKPETHTFGALARLTFYGHCLQSSEVSKLFGLPTVILPELRKEHNLMALEVKQTDTIFNHSQYPPITQAVKVSYCPGRKPLDYSIFLSDCKFPVDFCDFGPCWEKCRDRALTQYPQYYQQYLKRNPSETRPEVESGTKSPQQPSPSEGAAAAIVAPAAASPSPEAAPTNKPSKKGKKESSPKVTVQCVSRAKHKTATVVTGLDGFGKPHSSWLIACFEGVKLDAAAKVFKKHFACGSSAVKGLPGQQDHVEIQGDFHDTIESVIMKNFSQIGHQDVIFLKSK